jgi:hypothetical protein
MARETQLWIFVDLELSGPIIGTHSLIDWARWSDP